MQIAVVKNRFRSPSFIGYRDILVKLRLRIPLDDDGDGAGGNKAAAGGGGENAGSGGGGQGGGGGAMPESEARGFWHMCELQICIAPVEDHLREANAHASYEYFRHRFGSINICEKPLRLLLAHGDAATPVKIISRSIFTHWG